MTTTIGALTNVPAPGDPIRSPWAQDVTKLGVHVFATKAALDGWAAADGAQAWVMADVRAYVRIGGVWCRCPDYGSATATTDASGNAVINHAVGKAPAIVLALSGTPSGAGAYTVSGTASYTATTFTVRTSLVSASNAGIRWLAWP